ncbi:MAG TPA: ABC transporter substrate-binding protein [Candidatus Sulfotelmatobacter sp.]|nr:ABC transporter substrate-binding protein [Candidatus Sulfotelmatobacter sp.]
MLRALRWIALLGGLVMINLGLGGAVAAPTVPPRAVVEDFYRTLLDVMKHASSLGFDGRYRELKPAIEQAYNLPLMIRLAVGPAWTGLSADQQKRLLDAFERFTIATYANRFDGYEGEYFEVRDEKAGVVGGATMVETRLVPKKGDAVELNYMLRPDSGKWQIIDVFLSGTISELATRRAEFTSVLRRDGADGLVAMLEHKVGDLRPR